jgi:cyanate lyase
MTRDECTALILELKRDKGITWQAIAEAVGRDVVWTTAALLGQMKMEQKEADAVDQILGIGPAVTKVLLQDPMKGSLPSNPPTDPLIYRFYEIVQVYGTTLKELIHEQFGDGIMSAIDYTMHLERVADPKGDRVRVTMEGKFLPFKKW